MSEVWKAVIGFEGLYEVSDQGRVRSLDRVLESPNARQGYPRKVRGQILKLFADKDGYPMVSLCGKSRLVGRLVIAAFKGPRPPGMVVCHNDGVKQNSSPANLRYDTPKGNCADKVAHGTAPRGENQGGHKLTTAEVLYIRSSSVSRRTLADRFGVHPDHISHIRSGRAWAHV